MNMAHRSNANVKSLLFTVIVEFFWYKLPSNNFKGLF